MTADPTESLALEQVYLDWLCEQSDRDKLFVLLERAGYGKEDVCRVMGIRQSRYYAIKDRLRRDLEKYFAL